jgi:hypothetical protein
MTGRGSCVARGRPHVGPQPPPSVSGAYPEARPLLVRFLIAGRNGDARRARPCAGRTWGPGFNLFAPLHGGSARWLAGRHLRHASGPAEHRRSNAVATDCWRDRPGWRAVVGGLLAVQRVSYVAALGGVMADAPRLAAPRPVPARERRDRHPGDVLHRDRLLVVGQHVRRGARQDPKARVQTRQHRAQAAVPQRDHDPKLQAVLRPPPTPSRRAAHLPASPDIRRRMSGGTRSPPGRGALPQFPSSTSERSTPSTPLAAIIGVAGGSQIDP